MKTLLRKTSVWEMWVEIREYGYDMKELHFFSESKLEGYKSLHRIHIDREACDNLVTTLSQLKFD